MKHNQSKAESRKPKFGNPTEFLLSTLHISVLPLLITAGLFTPVAATAQSAFAPGTKTNAPVVTNQWTVSPWMKTEASSNANVVVVREPVGRITNYWTWWPWMKVEEKPYAPAGVREPKAATISRLSLAARFGFGISAKFSGVTPIALPTSTGTTPAGATYDNGYVLYDSSGTPTDGATDTWNIGYDDSASQVNTANNTINFSRSTGTANLSSPESSDDLSLGAEVTYTRQLGEDENKNFRYGFELAGNFLNTSIRSVNPYALRGDIQTDAYAYTPGTTPPTATPGFPYLSTFNGPGFTIGNTPVSSIQSLGTVGNVTGSRSLEADLWGARLGPYLEYYLDADETFSLGLSGGLALGYLTTDAAWNETVTFNDSSTLTDTGSGSDSSIQVGFYVGANALWRLDENWGVMGSVQYQNLGSYDKVFGTRKVELDLSKSIFVTVGVSYSF